MPDAPDLALQAELRFIQNAVRSGDTAQLLKSLDERGTAEELVQREYGGRYIFELLQNANDAAGAKTIRGTHSIRIMLTDNSLLVANQGQAFQSENVRSLCTLGRSSKDPRKSLGYKGLGFKAVGEITDQPQVISPPYQFGFSEDRARRGVAKLAGVLPPGQRLPVYAFPFKLSKPSLGADAEAVTTLLREGCVTVIRLPFRPGVHSEQVLSHIFTAVNSELLLFLDATSEIHVSTFSRSWRFAKKDNGKLGDGNVVELRQNEASPQRWLVFRSGPIELPSKRLVEQLDRTWQRVRTVSASIAFPLDGTRLAVDQPERAVNVYFPTDSRTGASFLINADFYLDLDRRHVSETPQALPYNSWLAERIGFFFKREVLPELTRQYPKDYRLVNACALFGSPSGFGQKVASSLRNALESTRCVPARAGSVTPRSCFLSPVPTDAVERFQTFFGDDKRPVSQNLIRVEVEKD